MEHLGRHLLSEFYNCDAELLDDVAQIEQYMIDAAKVAGSTVVQSVFHRFNPWGVSGVVVIAESHLAIHTWPEYGYASVDFYTCGEDVDPWLAFRYLSEKLNAKITETREFKRGIKKRIRKYADRDIGPIHYKSTGEKVATK